MLNFLLYSRNLRIRLIFLLFAVIFITVPVFSQTSEDDSLLIQKHGENILKQIEGEEQKTTPPADPIHRGDTMASDEEAAIPPLTGRVVDRTGTLSRQQIKSLERKLMDLERRKGSQITVVIIPTTGYETIEEYSIRLAEKWKIGRKNVDDGVILLVAKQDRRLRIEVGYGLEGAIPDARAKQIISDIIVPEFKQRDYAGGIEAGVDALITLINGEELPGITTKSSSDGFLKKHTLFLFIGLLILGMLLRSIFGSILGGVTIGAIGFIVGWMLVGLAMGVIIGIGLFFLTLSGLSSAIMMSSMGGGGGGFSSGGGGGFSGGGGSFGGGGASGSW